VWSRRDQLQAYQFSRRRLVSAVLMGDADHPESPSRRLVISIAAGIGATLLVLAGFGVYGVLRPGAAKSWEAGGQVILERETGARFVLDTSGALHPVLNYASARLFLGKDDVTTVSVSHASLTKARRGPTLGIAGAPDALPAQGSLRSGPWSVCSAASIKPGTVHTPRVVAALGVPPGGQRLAAGQALLVATPSGTQYLVTDGRRFLVTAPSVAAALGFGDAARTVPVGLSWVNALPSGPDLRFIAVDGAGRPGPVIDGRAGRVGDVYRVTQLNGEVQYHVLLAGGLDRITETEAQLMVSAPSGPAHGRIVPLSPAALAAAPVHRPALAASGYPQRLPVPTRLSGGDVAVCATTTDPAGEVVVDVRSAAPTGLATSAMPPTAHPSRPGVVADDVSIPAGSGAVVREAVSSQFASNALYVVTDEGVRYPVGDLQVLATLGYAGVSPVAVPASMLDLLPVGPRLDPAAAGLQSPRS